MIAFNYSEYSKLGNKDKPKLPAKELKYIRMYVRTYVGHTQASNF